MNAAETIAAAIAELEAIKAIRGVTESGWLWEIDPTVTSPTDDPRVGLVQGGPDVTLHRTIDAQLAILRNALSGANDLDAGSIPDEPGSTHDALALARAILGES